MANIGGFQAGTAAIPASKVEISVSCKNLRNMDWASKSDPMCVIYTRDIKSNRFIEYGRTETIQDDLHPEFTTKFVMNYFFEESQKLKFDVYDIDSQSRNLDQHDYIGGIEVTLGELVGSPGSSCVRKLASKTAVECGLIILRAEEMSSSKENATLKFQGKSLDQKNWFGLFGKSDPFLIFYRANEDASYSAVHKTETIKNTLNPDWKPFTIPLTKLCNGDYDRSLKVECYDWNSSGSHEIIGEFITNVREFNSEGHRAFELTQAKKKKSAGQIILRTCHIVEERSFLDYIKGGMQMNFTVAIDFTASNGNPQTPNSLHYYNPYQMNQYASAIVAVGEIIKDYDSDKMFPALGFGARMPDGNVSHEFALNFQPQNPFCSGVDGVLAAYYHSLKCVQLYGPTNFAPVINHVSRFASAVRDGSEYFVLLIITDGIITDMPQTKEAIVRASILPMSIIIVGVGDADFDAMDVLDGDDQRLSSNGRYAERDIVQFVPFRNYLTSGSSMNVSQAFLAKEVLAEIPDQVLSYMKRYNIQPKPPLPANSTVLPQHQNSQAVPPYPGGGVGGPTAYAPPPNNGMGQPPPYHS